MKLIVGFSIFFYGVFMMGYLFGAVEKLPGVTLATRENLHVAFGINIVISFIILCLLIVIK